MKKKNIKPLIISALLAVGFGATSVSTTFALFTDNANTQIQITSGIVDIETAVPAANLQIYSAEADPVGTVLDENNNKYTFVDQTTTFKNGGTATFANDTLTLTNITPGDGVRFKLTTTNKSNVAIKYRFSITGDGDVVLLGGLRTTIENSTASVASAKFAKKTYDGLRSVKTDWIEVGAGAGTNALGGFDFDVYLPLTRDNRYQNRTAGLKIALEVVQGNAVTEGEKEEITIPEVDGVINYGSDVTNALDKGGYWILGQDYDFSDYTPTAPALMLKNDMVVDLNGFEYTSSGYIMVSPASGSINIVDSSADHSGSIVSASTNPLFIALNNSTINVNNVNVESAKNVAQLYNGSSISFNDCKMNIANNSSAITTRTNTRDNNVTFNNCELNFATTGTPINLLNARDRATVTLNNTDVTSANRVVFLPEDSTLNVSNSYIQTDDTLASGVKNCVFNITDGSVIEAGGDALSMTKHDTMPETPCIKVKDSTLIYGKLEDAEGVSLHSDNLYLSIDNSTIKNANNLYETVGIGTGGSFNVEVKNNSKIEGLNQGIYVSGQDSNDVGNLSISNSTVKSNGQGILYQDNSNQTLNVNNSTIEGETGIVTNGSKSIKTTLNLTNASVTGEEDLSMYIAGCKELNISGGTYTGVLGGVEVRSGDITITNNAKFACETIATADYYYKIKSNDNGSTTIGAALAIAQHTFAPSEPPSLSLVIESGIFEGLVGLSISNPEGNTTNNVAYTINGGTFNGTVADIINLDSRVSLNEITELVDNEPTSLTFMYGGTSTTFNKVTGKYDYTTA